MALAKKNLFFSENRTQNVLEKLAPEPFLKDPNWVYHWKQSERLYSLFIVYPNRRPPKYSETKVLSISFYLI